MDNYQLAKLVQWAGTLHTRKRLQKVVYLLQSRNCPLEADFFLHHYGPYSNEVARLTDALVKNELLVEHESETLSGKKYDYTLSQRALDSLEAFACRHVAPCESTRRSRRDRSGTCHFLEFTRTNDRPLSCDRGVHRPAADTELDESSRPSTQRFGETLPVTQAIRHGFSAGKTQ